MTLPVALRGLTAARIGPLAVALMGACLAAASGLWMHRENAAQAAADFERSAARVARVVESRILQPVYGLKGARGLYAAVEQVHRREFRAYVQSRDLPREFPGSQGFGFIERVSRAEVPAFVAAERTDDAPQFAVRALAATDHDDLYVIKYLEPAASHGLWLGLDIGSEPVRREAAERAVATGLPTVTAPITLGEDGQGGRGFLLFVPVFRQGSDPATPAERRQALVGLLFAPMVVGEVLAANPEVVSGMVQFQLADVHSGDAFFDTGDGSATGSGSASPAMEPGRFRDERRVSLPGGEGLLRVRSTPLFDAAHANVSPWLSFAGGVLASVLLAAALAMLLRQQASLRSRAEALAEGLTADLDRLAQVARHTTSAVLTTDHDQRINWVNEGFTRLTGYSGAQATGRTVEALLGAGTLDASARRELASSIAAGRPCRVEVSLRAADGREVWLDLDVQSMRDARGALTGSMQIGSDITERRRTQERLESALRDTDALLRVINTHAIVSVTDRAGRIVEANDAFCSISGYTREELLQQNHRIVNSRVQPPAFWVDMWRTIAAGNPWRGEVCNRNKDGRMYWVDTLIAPFLDADGRIEKYVSIRTDITVSKNAARELARQRRRLDNILEGTQVGTWEWNVETGETVFNERWAEIVGYSLAELMPTTVDTVSRLTHPEDVSRASVLLERHFNGDLPVHEYEVRLHHKAGHWVWVLGRGKLFSRSEDGRPRWMAGTIMDITERKHAEAALRASQTLLDKTGRIAGVGGWALELDAQSIHWSDQTCRIHGLEPGHQPLLEEAIGYYAPEARETVALAVKRCIDHGESFDLELPMVTAQGRSILVRSVGELESADGRPVRLVGTFQDVTARHGLEADVRRQSEVLTSVIENLPCGVSVFDSELRLVAFNSEFRRLLDFPDTLVAGPTTRFEDVIRFNAERGEYGPGDVEATVQAIVQRARQVTVQHQFERVRPNGIPLEIRGGPMPGGGFVTTYTDISERRNAEAEVQRSSQLLRGAIEALDEAFVLYDADDRLVFCSDKYREVYARTAELIQPGVTFEEIVRTGAERGQYPEALGRVDAWVAERLAAHRNGDRNLIQRLDNGRTLRVIERRMPDGHTVGFRIDITEIVRAVEVAEAASLAKGQFLANMSHEIRTPMNAILGMLALLKKTELTVRQRDYAGKTESAARSLLGLLNDILDFSKVEAGKMTLDPHPFRADQLLRNLAVILAANTGGKQIELLFDIDPRLPAVLVGDAMRLQQVLINLGGNAVKFTAKGEVVVSVSVLQRMGETVTLEFAVSDSGIGIAPENQTHIFSGFSQAEASTTRRFGGTGLGLAICQRLVGLMNGELQLDSALGRGSRFHFRIELAVGSEQSSADLAPLRVRQPFPLRVLMVDDNALARELLASMAQSLGWQVTLADSGAAALACLEDADAPFDAAFIDWQMPGLDGWQTCHRIRQLCASGTRPLLIMVTAHGAEMLTQRSDDEQTLLSGFLVKPVTASMLYDAVADARADPDALMASRTGSSPEGQRLAGLHLLVAEDNANNQQVARELLEAEGAHVQIADNGQLAVEAVAAADPPFDLVLMDLQMPVMDGYTATRKIRENLPHAALPIVAMTANAMDADREACLAAGMDEHIGKPFDLDHLVAVLRRLTGRAAGPVAGRGLDDPGAALPAAVRAAAGAAGVDIERALARLGGKRKVYGRALRSFTTDLRLLPQRLDGLALRGQRDELRRELHTLKGLAATIGVTALATLAAEAEARLAGGSPAGDEAECVRRVRAGIDTAVGPLASLCDALDGGEGAPAAAVPRAALSPVDTAVLASHLRTLQGLLQASDLDAADALQTLRGQLPSAAGARLDALETAVESLEFESALSNCDEWLLECES